jgi:hypothetical protein
MNPFPTSFINTRLGFHYYPDTLHYRESDLCAWLPELRTLGASWITLVAPPDRAIPEAFVRGLLESGIQPVLHFHIQPDQCPQINELSLLFNTYTRWGIKYVAMFDRPNLRTAWGPTSWAQNNLVERFLDIYLPLAETALKYDLIPVFPPLEPGGDYWDTAFLRASLQGIQRRGHLQLLEKLVLGAYAWTDNKPLNWGAGGPERWPGARPYHTPANEEDQRGFRIFDWYLTIAQAVLHEPNPIILIGAGSRLGDHGDQNWPIVDEVIHAQKNMTIAQRMVCPVQTISPIASECDPLEPVPPEVLACNFWLLSVAPGDPHASQAWFQPEGQNLPIVGALRQWIAERQLTPSFSNDTPTVSRSMDHPISHYLLIPTYEWGVADWHLDVIRPFVKKHYPTVGFSLDEALLAKRVTVVGGGLSFSDEDIDKLISAGCIVERISGDGTNIATTLATL